METSKNVPGKSGVSLQCSGLTGTHPIQLKLSDLISQNNQLVERLYGLEREKNMYYNYLRNIDDQEE